MNKVSRMIRDIRIVYGCKLFSFFGIAFMISLPSIFRTDTEVLKSIYSNTVVFFTALIVIEIAFFGIFYSGSQINKEAKDKLFNKKENMTYYQRLLVKNYHSLFIKFSTVFIAYLFQMYNIMEFYKKIKPFENNSFLLDLEISIGVYYLFYILSIYSIIVTLDLVTTVYYFLWRS
ncbi:hypothetical protein [Candidatus Cetobacterium colombiensis]|uniref:ABC transporter permease n=1 Tax=Candidatus Cetobacterium colombiensis TaxID=3073100 RepID=A0ABU4WCU9_9FUSO|nr:hypothetical protein [Candidatus Cetobacterium colombiensis]MDX8337351.1 hypothetical protein [Candidatus Cetobacterium colombiensis]